MKLKFNEMSRHVDVIYTEGFLVLELVVSSGTVRRLTIPLRNRFREWHSQGISAKTFAAPKVWEERNITPVE